jgi:hypothetical protein
MMDGKWERQGSKELLESDRRFTVVSFECDEPGDMDLEKTRGFCRVIMNCVLACAVLLSAACKISILGDLNQR